MIQSKGCTHNFDYLLKQHDDGYTGRVLQIPAVISSGSTIDEVNSKIKTATLAYLRESEKTHADDLNGKLKPTLVTPNSGIVLQTTPFNVKC